MVCKSCNTHIKNTNKIQQSICWRSKQLHYSFVTKKKNNASVWCLIFLRMCGNDDVCLFGFTGDLVGWAYVGYIGWVLGMVATCAGIISSQGAITGDDDDEEMGQGPTEHYPMHTSKE